ncbi:9226_t:CDS:2 [Acaulospora morrowiae]|uniref:9226_t:CDS:1 n=1 Tax=Acaulospora morrowiae TaxID=94023 RepID=A0A9N8WH31_9GLOM|nr:9226_t:CDS:2 [Acaulospora morrowiae]
MPLDQENKYEIKRPQRQIYAEVSRDLILIRPVNQNEKDIGIKYELRRDAININTSVEEAY